MNSGDIAFSHQKDNFGKREQPIYIDQGRPVTQPRTNPTHYTNEPPSYRERPHNGEPLVDDSNEPNRKWSRVIKWTGLVIGGATVMAVALYLYDEYIVGQRLERLWHCVATGHERLWRRVETEQLEREWLERRLNHNDNIIQDLKNTIATRFL